LPVRPAELSSLADGHDMPLSSLHVRFSYPRFQRLGLTKRALWAPPLSPLALSTPGQRKGASPMFTSRDLNFADSFIEAQLIENAQRTQVPAGVVVNLSSRPLIVHGQVDSVVAPWRSTQIAQPLALSGERVARLQVQPKDNLGGVQFRGWDWFGDRFAKFPRDTPLFISPQDFVGDVIADRFALGNLQPRPDRSSRFTLKLNLWWSPPRTDCYIHNEHPFIELHTQIFGVGRMQKFWERRADTLYEDVPLSPGETHEPFFTVREDGSWEYPWHRYYADTDCIWLAIELHPLD
jgi:hypothetical protein